MGRVESLAKRTADDSARRIHQKSAKRRSPSTLFCACVSVCALGAKHCKSIHTPSLSRAGAARLESKQMRLTVALICMLISMAILGSVRDTRHGHASHSSAPKASLIIAKCAQIDCRQSAAKKREAQLSKREPRQS